MFAFRLALVTERGLRTIARVQFDRQAIVDNFANVST